MAFEETFKGINSENEISKNMMKWLDKSELIELVDEEDRFRMNEQDGLFHDLDKDEVEAKFKERLRDQDSEHNGGSFWIGTMGKTSFGNTGGNVGGVRVGGKTATSQTLPRGSGRYIASFIGFAPADDPQVLALCIVHDPQGIYYGGTVCAPVVKNIFENILPYLGIERK